jgi:MSHA biogenesis protein MshL
MLMNKIKMTLILLSLSIVSCAINEGQSIAKNEVLAIEKDIEESQINKDQKQEPVSLVIDKNLLVNGDNRALDANHSTKRFDVAVDNISARLFFANLMSDAKSNIVLHPDVTGNITLNLKQVTLEDVLAIVRDVYGYDYKYQNNIYTIYAKKLRTEIFPINYIDVKRVGVSDTSVLTGNVESTTQSDSESNQAQEADLVGTGTSIVPGARIQTHTETDFWSSLQESIAEIVGVSTLAEDEVPSEDSKGRKVIVNSQTGVAVVTAMPDELAAVRHFLAKAQLNVRKQVIIEAKILEIELSNDYQAGINWNQINGQLLLTNNVSEFTSPINITTAAEGVGEVFSSLIKISDLSQLLSLLKTQGNVQVLSSPRVSTVNNQKAVIRVGSDRFFVTGISNSTTTSSGSTTNNPEIELSSFFSGISLDVTPQIDDKGEVILHIHPVISSVTEEQKDITVGDQSFSLPLALRDIRESDSIVRAESGQIVVLGGLMQEKLMSVKGKRPILGDIPVVNSLFKTSAQNRVKSELIILLKPIVIGEQGWAAEISKSTERIKQNIN